MKDWQEGDRVVINNAGSGFHWEPGTVVAKGQIYGLTRYRVQLDRYPDHPALLFQARELVPERETRHK